MGDKRKNVCLLGVMIEHICHEGVLLALFVPAQADSEATTFYTPDEASLQCGRVVHGAGSEIPRHRHQAVSRNVVGTAEVLLVEKGTVIVSFYDQDGGYACDRTLTKGDVIVLLAGGHGFQVVEDAVLLEVKQGPYLGSADKQFF
jgi:hypothetical protein